MKLGDAAHAVFGTPELAFSLFAYLTPQDLAQCVRVCKQWLYHAEPILWRNFSPEAYYYAVPPSEAIPELIRNLPYIRTVMLDVRNRAVLRHLSYGSPSSPTCDGSAAVPRAACNRLRRLEIEDWHAFESIQKLEEHTGPLLPSIVPLLNHNLRLTHVALPFQDVDIDDPVLAAISNLKHLQHFSVKGYSMSPTRSRTMSLLLQACLPLPKLTELWINLEISWLDENTGVPSLQTIIKETAKARFSQTPTPGRIKSLRLPFRPEGYENPLALPLLQSGLLDLESCTVLPFTRDSTAVDVEQMVREYCPNIKHLRLPSFGRTLNGFQKACAFIRGCSGLQSFVFDFYDGSPEACD
ncbi:hypothetical protein BGZ70_004165, partial [Mortierella alpina]